MRASLQRCRKLFEIRLATCAIGCKCQASRQHCSGGLSPRAKQAPVLSKGDLQSRSPSPGLRFPLTFELTLGLARFLGGVRDGKQDFPYWQRPTSTATDRNAPGTGKVSNITQTVAVRLR